MLAVIKIIVYPKEQIIKKENKRKIKKIVIVTLPDME